MCYEVALSGFDTLLQSKYCAIVTILRVMTLFLSASHKIEDKIIHIIQSDHVNNVPPAPEPCPMAVESF